MNKFAGRLHSQLNMMPIILSKLHLLRPSSSSSSSSSSPLKAFAPNHVLLYSQLFEALEKEDGFCTSSSTGTSCQEHVKGVVHPNGVATITLHRPKSLNAVTLEMSKKYAEYLNLWAKDLRVKCIMVESSSPRAFSSGGDLKQLIMGCEISQLTQVFASAYSLVCKISEYQKPYISFMDGVTMGCGIGLSVHGRYRIVTERTLLAMPENAIGHFPDVGFAFIAAKSPGGGALGTYLGMTGKRILSPADALYAGLGSHYVPSRSLSSLKEALLSLNFSDEPHNDIHTLLDKYKEKPQSEAQLKLLLPHIAACFAPHKPVSEIFEDLKKQKLSANDAVAEWACDALLGLRKAAPFSLCLNQRHFSQIFSAFGNKQNHLSALRTVMKSEFRIALRSSLRSDFSEGVRAVLVNKGQKPKWRPARLEDVDMNELESAFSHLPPEYELQI